MALDTNALSAFLFRHGGGDLSTSPTVSALHQFTHGQSNPTYLVTLGDGRKLVLRKKPPGQILASAHAVEREFKVRACALAMRTPRRAPQNTHAVPMGCEQL